MTRYTRRHYQDTVKVVAKTHALNMNILRGTVKRETIEMLALVSIEEWSKLYRQDNGWYYPTLFVQESVKACGIDWTKLPRSMIPPTVADCLIPTPGTEGGDEDE
jgi:hypothetical protein